MEATAKISTKDEDVPCMGRPTSFNQALALGLYELAKDGKTDEELAKAAGVSVSTLANWKNRYPDFLESLKEAKSVADELVEASLFQRACGYSHPAIKFIVVKGVGVVREDYVEHYPPDTTACIFWLKNRQPERWRDKHEVDTSVKVEAMQTTLVKALKKLREK